MNKNKLPKRVGVLVFTEYNDNLCVVLQQRGYWNTEKHQPESFPTSYQFTFVGRTEESDLNASNAMFREGCEEVGDEFVKLIFQIVIKPPLLHFETFHGSDELEAKVMKVEKEALSTIRLHPSSGGIRLLTLKEFTMLAAELDRSTHKHSGPPCDGKVYMFDDEIHIVQKAFRRLQQ